VLAGFLSLLVCSVFSGFFSRLPPRTLGLLQWWCSGGFWLFWALAFDFFRLQRLLSGLCSFGGVLLWWSAALFVR
jgi:hypothetical protein